MPNDPLTDDQVYQLLHEMILLGSNKVVSSPEAKIILTKALLDLENYQRALLIATELETE